MDPDNSNKRAAPHVTREGLPDNSNKRGAPHDALSGHPG
jgi:hypothetical protein